MSEFRLGVNGRFDRLHERMLVQTRWMDEYVDVFSG
jgi:hypothetical protein